MPVQQLALALEQLSAAAEPLVGSAWREVPAFTALFGLVFFAALPFWVRSWSVFFYRGCCHAARAAAARPGDQMLC